MTSRAARHPDRYDSIGRSRHGHLRELAELDCGHRLIIARPVR